MNTKNTKPKSAAEPAKTPPATAPPAGKREGLVARIAELRKQLADSGLKCWPPDSPAELEWIAANEELRKLDEHAAEVRAAARAEAEERDKRKKDAASAADIEAAVEAADEAIN